VSAGLDLYRDLVAEHFRVPDDVVESYLTLAARRHTAAAFGVVYAEAMVWWSADQIEQGRIAGAITVDPDMGGDGDPQAPPKLVGQTRFERLYNELRDTRAAGSARSIRVG
jgi:hypothetical protein